MRLAVVADIHANLPALEAVLADIDRRQPDDLICCGDLVGYGASPNEVVSRLRERKVSTVAGNYDDGIGNRRLICGCDFANAYEQELGEQSIRWTLENTSEETRAYLRSLPTELTMSAGGRTIHFFHGSPRRLNEYLRDSSDEGLLREVGELSGADILVFAHTHRPFHRLVTGRHFINAGSVGKPKHGNPNAIYALIEVGEAVAAHFIEVPYDVERAARAVEEAGLPVELANRLRRGVG